MDKERKLKKALEKRVVSRPKPSAPRAGVKASKSRYGEGGKVTRKKNI